jgi:hypothetical protein
MAFSGRKQRPTAMSIGAARHVGITDLEESFAAPRIAASGHPINVQNAFYPRGALSRLKG